MEIFLLLVSIASVTFIGWNILYLVTFGGEKLRPLESLCVSYGLGAGLVTAEMFCFYFFGIKYTISRILTPWLALVILNVFLYFRTKKTDLPADTGATGHGNRVFISFLAVCLAIEIAFTFFNAMIKPLEAYDAIAIYGIKSKIFYLARSVPSDYFVSLARALPHPDYPLNIPLFETYVYLFIGNLNDQLVKMIFPLYYTAALGILYCAVRRFAGMAYALLFTFLMASVHHISAFAANAYADLPMAYYYFASAVFLFLWFRDTRKVPFLVISAFMSALAGWTKNEGLMYCLINFLMIGIFLASNIRTLKKRDAYLCGLYILTVVIVLYPFFWVRNSAHLVNTDVGFAGATPSYMLKQLYKVKTVAYEFQKEFFGPKKWNIFWPVIALALIFRFKKAFCGTQKYITFSIAIAIAGYTSIYLISPIYVSFIVEKTLSRFLIHFMPLAVYWLALVLKEDIDI